MKQHPLPVLAATLALAVATAVRAEETTRLEEVVVTAPMVSEPLTVVTDPKAPRQPVPAHDGADYLKNIPGFSVIRKGGTDGDPVLRGLAGSRLNVQMDGQTILGGCGGRMDPPTAYVFPEAYDRILVRKGPQTVLHGGGNLAGTTLFERNTKHFDAPGTRGFVSALAGSFDRNDLMADVTSGGPGGYVRAVATRTDANDYEDGDGRRVHSAYMRWSGSLLGGWTPDANTRVELSVDRSDGEAAYADRSMDGTVFDRTSYGVKLEKTKLSTRVEKLEVQAFHHYVDHVMDNYSLRPIAAGSKFLLSNPDRTTEGARLAATLALGPDTRATVGADYQEHQHTLRQWTATDNMYSAIDVNSRPRTPDMTFENLGVFAEVTHQLNPRDRVIGGLRFDTLDVKNEKTTGSGALSSDTDRTKGAFLRHEHDFESGLTSYVGLGHAERPADWWERSTYNNFYLDPEKATQLDAGLVYAGGRWRASLSAFANRIDDYILTRDTGTVKSARNINASTYGAEADASYAVNDRWTVTGALAWVRGSNDTDGTALAQMPPLEGRLGLQHDVKNWSLGVLARLVAEQDRVHATYGSIVGQDIGRTPGYTVFSLNAGWRPRKGALVTAGVDNVFDKTYAEHLSRTGTAVAGYTQTVRVNEPGRNLWLKANIAFD